MEDVGGPDLEEGEEIEFDIEQADKGPRATNVVRNWFRFPVASATTSDTLSCRRSPTSGDALIAIIVDYFRIAPSGSAHTGTSLHESLSADPPGGQPE